ncbi:receptor-like protein 33 [Salvia miltiorrhiza]|uniref:receptor-like protein 33 n=1 Tax=Salvia miltiorrhiza TaxID=226208 RepID=UPI0025AD1742|nr:receptor-like protein 33 [Salvia miltiorrhiza]
MTALARLSLANNSLSGTIPSSICNLTSLDALLLSNNNLEGTIPQCFGNLSKSLFIFHLNVNQFSGLIPSSFSKGCGLVSINLNGNKLQGPLPKSLINCQRLRDLDVGNNRIQDEFPFWMEVLPDLRVLVLRANKFYGNMSLPSQTKIPFHNLQVLDISQNRFVGSLPQGYFKNFRAMIEVNETSLSTNDTFFKEYVEMRLTLKGLDQLLQRLLSAFTTIDLSSNRFSGSIPHSIGNLKILKYLNLSHNNLIGNIPSSLGNLSELESLDLSVNKLDGEIPSELTGLTFLAKLNLSMNNFVGQIPQSKQFSTFENDSYVGNLRLCGVPLTRKCNDENGHGMKPQEDDDEEDEFGFIDGFGWRSVVMGYGSGLIVGIGIGYIIIRNGRPRWLVEFFFGIGYNNNNNKKKKKKKKRRSRATPTPTRRRT